MLVSVDDIRIKHRVRKDLGDLESLKESLRHYGLLHPITVNRKMELVAGHRRLEAAKLLGWTKIEANIISETNKKALLQMELDENIQREDFTQQELYDGYLKLERIKHPPLWKRILLAIKEFFNRLFKRR